MKYIDELMEALQQTVLSYDGDCYLFQERVGEIVEFFRNVRNEGRKVFFIGNGGSAAIASHMTVDYMKNGKIVTCSTQESPMLTCLSNDFSYLEVYSKQIESLGKAGDVLVAISSSGNSENIIRAIDKADSLSMSSITLSGFDATNMIRSRGSYNVYVPSHKYGIVESIHQLILQEIVDLLMED